MGTEIWQLVDSPPVADWCKAGAIIIGLPGVSLQRGLLDPLPVGVQAAAGRFGEGLCLDAAEIIEARAALPTPIEP